MAPLRFCIRIFLSLVPHKSSLWNRNRFSGQLWYLLWTINTATSAARSSLKTLRKNNQGYSLVLKTFLCHKFCLWNSLSARDFMAVHGPRYTALTKADSLLLNMQDNCRAFTRLQLSEYSEEEWTSSILDLLPKMLISVLSNFLLLKASCCNFSPLYYASTKDKIGPEDANCLKRINRLMKKRGRAKLSTDSIAIL